MTIAETIYLLGTITSLAAAVLLLRYSRPAAPGCCCGGGRFRLVAVNNVVVYVDLGLLPDVDLSMSRTAAGAIGMLALAYALVLRLEAMRVAVV